MERVTDTIQQRRRAALAFSFAVPIALLGGLIGLGGAEFRLPVLVGPLGIPVRRAVPLNLLVSLVTLMVSLIVRSRTLSLAPLAPLLPPMMAMILGGVTAAFLGTTLLRRLSSRRLERLILVLLVTIGCILIVEAFLPDIRSGFVPPDSTWQIATGVLFGLIIGLFSSLLGVAGGELIIPTLLFAYGAGIKIAGTASLFISLPTVLMGVVRYTRQGMLRDRNDLLVVALPMGFGSVIGALLGGLLVGIVPVMALKLILGVILIASAVRIFRHR